MTGMNMCEYAIIFVSRWQNVLLAGQAVENAARRFVGALAAIAN